MLNGNQLRGQTEVDSQLFFTGNKKNVDPSAKKLLLSYMEIYPFLAS
jgi:hypothetical protein